MFAGQGDERRSRHRAGLNDEPPAQRIGARIDPMRPRHIDQGIQGAHVGALRRHFIRGYTKAMAF